MKYIVLGLTLFRVSSSLYGLSSHKRKERFHKIRKKILVDIGRRRARHLSYAVAIFGWLTGSVHYVMSATYISNIIFSAISLCLVIRTGQNLYCNLKEFTRQPLMLNAGSRSIWTAVHWAYMGYVLLYLMINW